jgi:transcription elongation factor Elf1
MSQCSNCNQQLSCGCQKKNASNGIQVCSNCLSSYESQIQATNQPSVITEAEVKTETPLHRRGQSLRKFIK